MFHDDDTLKQLDNFNKRTKERTQPYRNAGVISKKHQQEETLQNIEDYEYASFIDRLLATIIDCVILGIPLIIIENTYKMATHSFFTLTLFELILPLIITALFWNKMGGTPGKMLMNMMIIDQENKNKISIPQSILRYFGYIPSILFFGFGFIWIAIDNKNQAWHDKLAGTIVVKKIKQNKVI